MKDTIDRLRDVRERILTVAERRVGTDRHAAMLRVAAEHLTTSIDELQRVQDMTEALAPAYKAVREAVGKAYAKRCSCGVVDVTMALTGGYRKTIPGRINPACPIHGGSADV